MRMTFFGDDGGSVSTFWKDSASILGNGSQQVSMRSCYPPHFTYQPDLFATDGYVYSPGVCPMGYYAAKSNGAMGKQQAATSWCCPNGMTFSAFQGCVSLTTPASSTTLYYGHDPLQQLGPYYVLEPYIPVAWDSADLKLFTPTSAPLSVSQQCRRVANSLVPVNGGAPAAGISGSTGSKDVPGLEAGGLSTAAKAGIGVGVALAVISAVVMIVLLLKYRRKANAAAEELKRRDQSDTLELKNGLVVVSEADADSRAEADFENGRAEADSMASVRPELDSLVVRAEADGSSLRHELDSGWHGHEKGNE